MKGKIISFEGIDGSGKTTQVGFIKSLLEKHNIKYGIYKEPSDVGIGKIIKKNLKESSFDLKELYRLFIEDRKIQYEKEIKPRLKEGYLIIMDRYLLSTYSYHREVVCLEKMLKDNEEYRKPDLTIYLDIDEKESKRRILKRRPCLDIFESEKFLEKVRERYIENMVYLESEHKWNISIYNGLEKANKLRKKIYKEVKKII